MNDFLKKFMAQFQEEVVNGSQHYIDHHEYLKQQAKIRLDKAQSEYRRNARRWGYLHRTLGLAAVLSSIASAVFTLSLTQAVTVTLSLLSAIFAGCMTFLNPSDMEIKFRNVITDCFNFHSEVYFASVIIHDRSKTDEEKLRKLEDLNRSLKFLDERLSKII